MDKLKCSWCGKETKNKPAYADGKMIWCDTCNQQIEEE